MDYCTICHKNPPTIHILDLKDGKVKEQTHLCAACAESAGLVQPKVAPLKQLSTEFLEDIVKGMGITSGEPRRGKASACPGCGLTEEDFRMRGRMGCPRCYEAFHDALASLLERVHDARTHVGRYPSPPSSRPPDMHADLRRKLAQAVREEKYEEAASLRDQLKQLDGNAEESP